MLHSGAGTCAWAWLKCLSEKWRLADCQVVVSLVGTSAALPCANGRICLAGAVADCKSNSSYMLLLLQLWHQLFIKS